MRKSVGGKSARSLGPEYRKLWSAGAVSNLGDGVLFVCGPLLAATITRDPFLISGVAFALSVPWLLFSLVSGALVDRLDRRWIMVSVDVFRAALIAFLGFSVYFDFASLSLMYVVFFALGTAETLFDNASTSVLPAVVERDDLDRANGRLFGVQIVTNQLAGPPLGGFLFAFAAAVPFFLVGGTFFAAAALVLCLRGRFKVERDAGQRPTTLVEEIREGMSWLWGQRLIRTLALSLALMNLTMSAVIAVLVLVAQERLGLGSVGYGSLMSAIAVGGIAGSLLSERVVGWLGPGNAMRCGLLIEASTHLVIALSTSVALVGVALCLFGFHAIVWNVVSISLRQRAVPDRLLGRVNSAYRFFSAGSMAFGALIGGGLASFFGLTAPFWFSFVVVALLVAGVWRMLSNKEIARVQTGNVASL